MDTLQMLLERRSVRSYQDTLVPQALLDQIIETGRFAPTGMGKQTVRYLVTQNPTWVRELSNMNAEVMNSTTDPFYGAPCVICVFADSNSHNWVKDGSLAMGNMMNAAHALGLGSCWINRCEEMFATKRGQSIMQQVGLDARFKGVGCMIVGYVKGEYPSAKPRMEDVVYTLK